MKILVISNLYPPDFLGGYELGCRQAVEALKDAGHTVQVVSGSPRNAISLDGDVHRRLKMVDIYDPYGNWKSTPLTQRIRSLEAHTVHSFNIHTLCDEIRAFQPDVCYVWNTIGLGGLGLLAALQHLGVPWVMHLMDDVPRSLCSPVGVFSQTVADSFIRYCEGQFICCSSTTLDEICSVGVPIADRTHIIPNWVITEGAPPRDNYRIDGHLKIVTAGAMSTAKGMDIVVKAAAELRDRGRTNFSIDMYGPGTDPLFRTLIQSLNVNDIVKIQGTRTQAELFELYSSYDVFAFPTWEREPMAFAPMEAMAHGCVSIISQTCGNSEWLVDGLDCIKTERSPVGLADAIDSILFDRVNLSEIGRRGAVSINRYFHLSKILPRIEAVLANAIENRRPGRGTAQQAYHMALIAEKAFECLLQESATAA